MIASGGRWRRFAVYAETLALARSPRSAIERFGIDAGRLHVDLTDAAGALARTRTRRLVAKGWASGPRGRAVRFARCRPRRRRGVSLYMRPDPGNAAEVALIGASAGAAGDALRAARSVDLATPPAG